MKPVNNQTIETSISHLLDSDIKTIDQEGVEAGLWEYPRSNLRALAAFLQKHRCEFNFAQAIDQVRFFLDDASTDLSESVAFSPPSGRKNIPVVDPIAIRSNFYESDLSAIRNAAIDFRDRLDMAYWRGALTGIPKQEPSLLSKTPESYIDNILGTNPLARVRLCTLARAHNDQMDFGITSCSQWLYGDILRSRLTSMNIASEARPFLENVNFKYLIDIDGNSNSWPGFFMKLGTGSCVLKVRSAHGFEQWYYRYLKKDVHYIEVNSDLSDLHAKLDSLIKDPAKGEEVSRNSFRLIQSKSPTEWGALAAKDFHSRMSESNCTAQE